MSVYLIIEVEVHDPATYGEYMLRVPRTVEKYGGRYVARSSSVVPLVGDWNPERLIILEFASMDAMTRWNTSPEYAEVAQLRAQSATTRSVAVEGYEGTNER
jgi:uncharacterized protein (DUF1330 family)